ncbi:mammalian cell entry protein [Mycobacterium asiaticum]|uniref:Mammalian cell entry protein n=1 Tax=Mycobacterium asiaticum TaxID=1790 RepID=A0A1A3N451_MYCAS|nr:mammalian cell entry protein [Mycobacterium asiaticum]OBK15829.1 mammalian cell entry protein [Mycobacterium asiaticum]
MSPRRKFKPGEESLLIAQSLPRRRWELALASTFATLVMVAAVTLSTLLLVDHVRRDRVAERETAAVNYVKWFMTGFTSIDPFHANDYIERILAQATGDFHKQYEEKANEILLQVARAERATGTVLDAGVERWNDDGSVTVLVATDVTSKSPDGKQVFENTNRWSASAKQEGNQWKISNLQQVI